MKSAVLGLAWFGTAAVACGSSHSSRSSAADAGEAGASSDAGLFGCPDPNDPAVHYHSQDPSQCPATELACDATQNGFQNACGCGCIDKQSNPGCSLPADTQFISRDPAACGSVTPTCAVGQKAFNNSCGCGCVTE